MDHDLIIVLGMLGLVLGIPAFMAAFADQRRPWLALLLVASGGGAVAYVILSNPGVYGAARIMDAIYGVLARIIS
jgi:uncharacterized membrane-anchored protein